MTYASIQEAWGGVSGNTSLHPVHQKRVEEFGNSDRLYRCNYGDQPCDESFYANQRFNNQKKAVAEGTQPFLPPGPGGFPGSPPPHNYLFSPQYPWYPWAQYGYLTYPPGVSAWWYGDPWSVDPYSYHRILQNQRPPTVPIQNPYVPNGFLPPGPLPRLQPPRKKEYFGGENGSTVNTALIYFIVFLVAVCIILVISMVLVCNK